MLLFRQLFIMITFLNEQVAKSTDRKLARVIISPVQSGFYLLSATTQMN